jgi:hypothetical protein
MMDLWGNFRHYFFNRFFSDFYHELHRNVERKANTDLQIEYFLTIQ